MPALLCYREAVGRGGAARPGLSAALVGVGYFAVWMVVGVMVFPLGAALADAAMRQPSLSRGVPMVTAGAVIAAGLLQRSGWKARHLTFCREASDRHLTPPAGAGAALHHGLHLGLHCSAACAGLTMVALVSGVMILHVMPVVAAAITAERLAPAGVAIARAVGVAVVAAGLLMISVALHA
jgi:predicted metal-binding membrane protein